MHVFDMAWKIYMAKWVKCILFLEGDVGGQTHILSKVMVKCVSYDKAQFTKLKLKFVLHTRGQIRWIEKKTSPSTVSVQFRAGRIML